MCTTVYTPELYGFVYNYLSFPPSCAIFEFIQDKTYYVLTVHFTRQRERDEVE